MVVYNIVLVRVRDDWWRDSLRSFRGSWTKYSRRLLLWAWCLLHNWIFSCLEDDVLVSLELTRWRRRHDLLRLSETSYFNALKLLLSLIEVHSLLLLVLMLLLLLLLFLLLDHRTTITSVSQIVVSAGKVDWSSFGHDLLCSRKGVGRPQLFAVHTVPRRRHNSIDRLLRCATTSRADNMHDLVNWHALSDR